MNIENIKVVLTKHAMLDCIPLRFGKLLTNKYGYLQGQLDEKETKWQKPVELRKGNKHYIGDFFQDDKLLVSNARFVLAKQKDYEYYRPAISVLTKNNSLATRGVSDIIRGLREANKITPKQIAEYYHPLYVAGRFENEQEFFQTLVDLKADEKLNDKLSIYKNEIQQKILEYDQKLYDKEKKIEDKDKRIKELEEQNKESDKLYDPQYDGEHIGMSPIGTLKKVTRGTRTDARLKRILCTYLEFEEPSMPIRKMDQWADRDGEKTKKAQRLIGRKVRTTVWKPEIYDPLLWFRNIYTVEVND